MVSLRALYKLIGNGMLTFKESGDLLLEVALNDRPLSYLEDDIEYSTLTPSSILHINQNQIPEVELKPRHYEDKDIRKRAKFLKQCKKVV